MSAAVHDATWTLLAVMTVITLLLRFLPFAVISRVTLPAPAVTWLGFMADAILISFVALFLFWDNGRQALVLAPAPTAAMLALAAMQVWRGNMYLAIATGMVSLPLFDRLFA